MALIVRPSLRRQSFILPVARQAPRRPALQIHALSKLNASSFRTLFIASCILPRKLYAPRVIPPGMLRVAGFHASGPRRILPAGPRE